MDSGFDAGLDVDDDVAAYSGAEFGFAVVADLGEFAFDFEYGLGRAQGRADVDAEAGPVAGAEGFG